MKDRYLGLMLVVAVSLVLAIGGIGYIYTFSNVFGNDLALSPTDSDSGIQYSPSAEGCQKVCDLDSRGNNIFKGCQALFQEFSYRISCRGVLVGLDRERLARPGATLCEFAECVYNN